MWTDLVIGNSFPISRYDVIGTIMIECVAISFQGFSFISIEENTKNVLLFRDHGLVLFQATMQIHSYNAN